MALNDTEIGIIRTCCRANHKLSLNYAEDENECPVVYRGRFLHVDIDGGVLVVDEPTAVTPGARALQSGMAVVIFFEFKSRRYIFETRVLDYTLFQFHHRKFPALKLSLPGELMDGDKREYFRVKAVTMMRPPVVVTLKIDGDDGQDARREFQGEMLDISGGGFSLRNEAGKEPLPLAVGDIFEARFRLKPTDEPMVIWSEVQNARTCKDGRVLVWGIRFMEKERNRNINVLRNRIMRYVTERQREIISK